MKVIMTSPEVFEAYANIDFGYYILKQLYKEISEPIAPINLMVDKATGADIIRIQGWRNRVKAAFEMIIESKKITESDYSGDQKALDELIKLENQ